MRDSKRIDIIMNQFTRLWKRMPNMRFHQMCQYVACAGNTKARKDAFYIEDTETLQQLHKLLQGYQS